MKKVIRIITRLNIGGPTLHVVNLTHGLKDSYNTILVSGKIESHETDMSYYAEKYSVSVRYLNNMSRELKFPADLIALWELYRLIKKEKPDIVHTHTAKAGTLGRIAAWLAGVPQIYHTFHGNVLKGFFSERKSKFFIFIERCLAKITTRIVAISEKQKQELIDFGVAKANKIEVIKLGFEFSNVLATDSDTGRFRTEFNIPKDAKVIAIIARITAIKNHTLFLDIAERLLSFDITNSVYFPIIGDGDLREAIEQDIKHRGLQNKVFVTGFIKDLKPVFADIDMTLITSHNEGTPVALIETMANGKIVLSTNVGGVSDFVDNGVNGFYFEEPKTDLFVNKIIELLEGKIDSKTLSDNARKTAIETFTVNRLLKDIDKLYTDFTS